MQLMPWLARPESLVTGDLEGRPSVLPFIDCALQQRLVPGLLGQGAAPRCSSLISGAAMMTCARGDLRRQVVVPPELHGNGAPTLSPQM